MYRISLSGIRLIQSEEGCVLHPYHGAADAPGIITIYSGHVVRPSERFDPPYTLEKADQVLRSDLSWVQSYLYRHCPWSLTDVPGRQHQFDALCSLVFNAGHVFDDLLALVNSETPVEPAVLKATWLKHDAANGKPGVLHFRRAKEAALYLTPDVPEEQIDRTEILAQVSRTAWEMLGP